MTDLETLETALKAQRDSTSRYEAAMARRAQSILARNRDRQQTPEAVLLEQLQGPETLTGLAMAIRSRQMVPDDLGAHLVAYVADKLSLSNPEFPATVRKDPDDAD